MAEKIAVAQTIGTLSLSLRSIADNAADLDRAVAAGEVKVIPGVGPATAERLRRAGIHTVADLEAVAEGELVRLLGQAQGHGLWQLARAQDSRSYVCHKHECTICEPRALRVHARRGAVGLRRGAGGRRTQGVCGGRFARRRAEELELEGVSMSVALTAHLRCASLADGATPTNDWDGDGRE